jgi:nucleotide-binding universal stress UspA family protein
MFDKILVCLDGSKLAEQILPYATEEALHFDSRLVLLQVVTPPSTFVTPGVPGVPGVPVAPSARAVTEAMQKDETAVRAYLESAARLIRAKGLKVDAVTLQGVLVGQMIVVYAKDNKVDLIAMATHGRSGLSRTVMGSIADYVIKESGLPILLIRPKKEA